jgi:hypothetical protein
MLEPNGRRVLQILGKDAGPTGIILVAQMASAVSALEGAVLAEEAEQKVLIDEAKARGEVPPSFDAVSLRKRAWPFAQMLRKAAAENADVVWGV